MQKLNAAMQIVFGLIPEIFSNPPRKRRRAYPVSVPPRYNVLKPGRDEIELASIYAKRVRRWLNSHSHPEDRRKMPGHIRRKIEFINAVDAAMIKEGT